MSTDLYIYVTPYFKIISRTTVRDIESVIGVDIFFYVEDGENIYCLPNRPGYIDYQLDRDRRSGAFNISSINKYKSFFKFCNDHAQQYELLCGLLGQDKVLAQYGVVHDVS